MGVAFLFQMKKASDEEFQCEIPSPFSHLRKSFLPVNPRKLIKIRPISKLTRGKIPLPRGCPPGKGDFISPRKRRELPREISTRGVAQGQPLSVSSREDALGGFALYKV